MQKLFGIFIALICLAEGAYLTPVQAHTSAEQLRQIESAFTAPYRGDYNNTMSLFNNAVKESAQARSLLIKLHDRLVRDGNKGVPESRDRGFVLAGTLATIAPNYPAIADYINWCYTQNNAPLNHLSLFEEALTRLPDSRALKPLLIRLTNPDIDQARRREYGRLLIARGKQDEDALLESIENGVLFVEAIPQGLYEESRKNELLLALRNALPSQYFRLPRSLIKAGKLSQDERSMVFHLDLVLLALTDLKANQKKPLAIQWHAGLVRIFTDWKNTMKQRHEVLAIMDDLMWNKITPSEWVKKVGPILLDDCKKLAPDFFPICEQECRRAASGELDRSQINYFNNILKRAGFYQMKQIMVVDNPKFDNECAELLIPPVMDVLPEWLLEKP